jgi:hypothetical protein
MKILVLVFMVLSCVGCSNPCKTLLAPADVQDVLGSGTSAHNTSNKTLCSASVVAAGSRNAFDVQVELERHPTSYAARNLEFAVSTARKKTPYVPLASFGDEAFASVLPAAPTDSGEDPGATVDQMIQRAALQRYGDKVNELASASGSDAGAIDPIPTELKAAPRNMGEYLDRLPPSYHEVLFRRGEWVGVLRAHRKQFTAEQFRSLIGRISPRVATLE